MKAEGKILLNDPDVYPDEDILKCELGEMYKHYLSLIELFDTYGLTYTWRYYNDGKSWLCKVEHKKRTIVWVSIWTDLIKAGFYFSAKHIHKVGALDIAARIKEQIPTEDNVKRLNECMFEIKDKELLPDFEKVLNLKIKCK
ncbi:DUF3788 family protein [Fusibacter ferrireducens]|uniref:DUF3788 family protein n=1 Tax=Fusibacter ferrireducens TaxID=2785058 RepID=A0ABR9ZV44_9FIRM|nr:DUF3788 family protein [Fusibacter ferrireducens]MBF4694310.1 DUF3788 family protein [Fusibacter ferrireducens]